jgi:hypothetical protein
MCVRGVRARFYLTDNQTHTARTKLAPSTYANILLQEELKAGAEEVDYDGRNEGGTIPLLPYQLPFSIRLK